MQRLLSNSINLVYATHIQFGAVKPSPWSPPLWSILPNSVINSPPPPHSSRPGREVDHDIVCVWVCGCVGACLWVGIWWWLVVLGGDNRHSGVNRVVTAEQPTTVCQSIACTRCRQKGGLGGGACVSLSVYEVVSPHELSPHKLSPSIFPPSLSASNRHRRHRRRRRRRPCRRLPCCRRPSRRHCCRRRPRARPPPCASPLSACRRRRRRPCRRQRGQ